MLCAPAVQASCPRTPRSWPRRGCGQTCGDPTWGPLRWVGGKLSYVLRNLWFWLAGAQALVSGCYGALLRQGHASRCGLHWDRHHTRAASHTHAAGRPVQTAILQADTKAKVAEAQDKMVAALKVGRSRRVPEWVPCIVQTQAAALRVAALYACVSHGKHGAFRGAQSYSAAQQPIPVCVTPSGPPRSGLPAGHGRISACAGQHRGRLVLFGRPLQHRRGDEREGLLKLRTLHTGLIACCAPARCAWEMSQCLRSDNSGAPAPSTLRRC